MFAGFLRYIGVIKMGVHRVKLDVGNELRIVQWADIVHPTEDGYVTVTIRKDGKWSEQSYPVDTWYNHIVQDQKVDCYYTPNTVYKPHRLVENARHINAFYVDLDFYRYSLSYDEVMNGIEFLIRTERLLEPTFIVYSGQGMYLFWQIENAPAKSKQVLKLFTHIQNFLIDTLKDFGADPQAKDVIRVLRVPSSYNTKTGEQVKIMKYSQTSYTMRFLQLFMNEALMIDVEAFKTPSKKPKKRATKGKIKRLYNIYSLAIARASDLRMLCKIRNYEIKGYRNAFVHVYAYQMFLIHNNHHVARGEILAFNDQLHEPLPKGEVEAIVKSTFKAYERHREDVTKGYNYKNTTLIDLLAISKEEQRQLKSIIDKEEKQRRNTIQHRERRRDEDGLTSRDRAKLEVMKNVSKLLRQDLKQKEIAIKLGISTGRVSQVVKDLKTPEI